MSMQQIVESKLTEVLKGHAFYNAGTTEERVRLLAEAMLSEHLFEMRKISVLLAEVTLAKIRLEGFPLEKVFEALGIDLDGDREQRLTDFIKG